MKRKTLYSALFLLVAIQITACGALFNGGPAKVTFSSDPDGAEVWVDGFRRGTTPVILDLAKDRDYSIMFKKDGYRNQVVALTKKVSVGFVVLDVLGGLLPVVVDAATGSWYVLSTDLIYASLEAGDPDILMRGQLRPDQLEMLKRGVPISRFVRMP